jgi:hypothetical protein
MVTSILVRHGVDGEIGSIVADEIAGELAARLDRPVVTTTYDDMTRAASAAGLLLTKVVDEYGQQKLAPMDTAGRNIGTQLGKFADEYTKLILSRLPETGLKEEGV